MWGVDVSVFPRRCWVNISLSLTVYMCVSGGFETLVNIKNGNQEKTFVGGVRVRERVTESVCTSTTAIRKRHSWEVRRKDRECVAHMRREIMRPNRLKRM